MRRGSERFAGSRLRQVSVRGNPLFQTPLRVLHRLIVTAPADKHSQRHAFINSPSICYLTDVAAIAEAVKVSKPFVHKTCKNSGHQTLEIPACQN